MTIPRREQEPNYIENFNHRVGMLEGLLEDDTTNSIAAAVGMFLDSDVRGLITGEKNYIEGVYVEEEIILMGCAIILLHRLGSKELLQTASRKFRERYVEEYDEPDHFSEMLELVNTVNKYINSLEYHSVQDYEPDSPEELQTQTHKRMNAIFTDLAFIREKQDTYDSEFSKELHNKLISRIQTTLGLLGKALEQGIDSVDNGLTVTQAIEYLSGTMSEVEYAYFTDWDSSEDPVHVYSIINSANFLKKWLNENTDKLPTELATLVAIDIFDLEMMIAVHPEALDLRVFSAVYPDRFFMDNKGIIDASIKIMEVSGNILELSDGTRQQVSTRDKKVVSLSQAWANRSIRNHILDLMSLPPDVLGNRHLYNMDTDPVMEHIFRPDMDWESTLDHLDNLGFMAFGCNAHIDPNSPHILRRLGIVYVVRKEEVFEAADAQAYFQNCAEVMMSRVAVMADELNPLDKILDDERYVLQPQRLYTLLVASLHRFAQNSELELDWRRTIMAEVNMNLASRKASLLFFEN